MPATFAHCLLARTAIERLGASKFFPGVLKAKNHFVVMGSTGPDYPYLTDVIKYGVLHIGHNWSNRMHYENTDGFIREGVRRLGLMDRSSDAAGEEFRNCLAWFAGYVSHVIADSYVHPVVNSIVHGTYIFTHTEHGRCELVQDIYIFNKTTGTDICKAAASDGKTFGYLNILDDCSDPGNLAKVHPHIRSFWTELLKTAHPDASQYFQDVLPDVWHDNYKKRVDFAADGRSIFRHVLDIADAPRYVPWEDIGQNERIKYVEKIETPGGRKSYDEVFNEAVDRITTVWNSIFSWINSQEVPPPAMVKDWNLDTGVDENIIDLWTGSNT